MLRELVYALASPRKADNQMNRSRLYTFMVIAFCAGAQGYALQKQAADINGDSMVDAVDVQLVINGALGVDIAGEIERRHFNRPAGFEQSRSRLHEATGLLGLDGVDILGVGAIVEPDAPDLSGAGVG